MSDDSQNRIRRFEIIKIIYGNLTLRNRPSSTYKEIAGILQIREFEVSNEIKVLGNAGFVGTQFASPERIVYLTPMSVQAMEQRPQPTTYDQFIQRTTNPQKEYSEPVKIEGPKGESWLHKHKTGIIIGIVSVIVGSISIIVTIGYGEGWFSSGK